MCVDIQAGLLLAETEFVMQVESDIAPFKDLLMGLFFMTVGMEISVGLFIGKFRSVMGALALLVLGKVRPTLRCAAERPEVLQSSKVDAMASELGWGRGPAKFFLPPVWPVATMPLLCIPVFGSMCCCSRLLLPSAVIVSLD